MDREYYDLDKLNKKEEIAFNMKYFYKYGNKELEKNKSNGYCMILALGFPIGALILIIFDSFFKI